MAAQRSPLREIADNTKPKRGKELTPYQRGLISGMRSAGASYTKISKHLDIPVSTVRGSILREAAITEGAPTPHRTGRPPITDERDKRVILRYVAKHPKANYDAIRRETGLNLSITTLKRLLSRSNIRKSAAGKEELNPASKDAPTVAL
jgi:transposase